jgi:Ca2+-binding RTX toxin-like protein
VALLALVTPDGALAQDCANDSAYPLDCAASAGTICTLTTTYHANDTVDCNFPGGSVGVTAYSILYVASGTADLHVFGQDQDGNNFCCIETPNQTGVDWLVDLQGGSRNDTFWFEYGSYDLRSYDETVMTVVGWVKGGAGNDTMTLPPNNFGHNFGVYLSTNYGVFGEAGSGTCYGSPLGDRMDGGSGIDYLYGNGGEDYLYGGTDNDFLFGGDDIDHLYGGDNDDELYGGDGDDFLRGDSHDDDLYGESGDDVMCGNNGTDWFYETGSGDNRIDDPDTQWTLTPGATTFDRCSDFFDDTDCDTRATTPGFCL